MQIIFQMQGKPEAWQVHIPVKLQWIYVYLLLWAPLGNFLLKMLETWDTVLMFTLPAELISSVLEMIRNSFIWFSIVSVETLISLFFAHFSIKVENSQFSEHSGKLSTSV